MVSTILFVFEQVFSFRNYQRFGADCLIENGFKIEVWNIIDITTPELSGVGGEEYSNPDCIVRKFSSRSELLSAVEGIPSSWFIVNQISYSPETQFFFRAISKKSLRYSVIMMNALPAPLVSKKSKTNFFSRILKLSPKKFRFLVHNRLPANIVGIKPADMILAGGEKSLSSLYHKGANTDIVWIHAFDYDLYLEERSCTEIALEETCVFFDEYYPFHPDYLNMKIAPPVSADTYYPEICRLFTKIERELGLRVIIAAHPRSEYEKHPDYFEGRQVVKGVTVKLVRQSKLVLLHCSTSINFSVLFRKPMLFVTSNDIRKSFYGPYIDSMAGQFGKVPINIDDAEYGLAGAVEMDEGMYATYQRNYIKCPGTPELPFWQIVAERLKAVN